MLLLLDFALAQTTTGGAPPPTSGQLFRPSIDSTHTLWVNDSGRAPDTYFNARAVGHYTLDPVVYETTNGDVVRVVGDLFQLSLDVGYTKGPIRFGVDVPVYLRNIGSSGGETGIGDIALDVKGTLLDRNKRAIGLALAGRASLPTSTVAASLGNQGFGWELEGIVDKNAGGLLLAANIGFRGVPKRDLENFSWGNQFVGRAGGGYAFTEHAGISVDFATHINLTDPVPAAIPAEGILGGWGGFQSLVVRGGIGTGLTKGFGAPALRVILSVGYEPPRTKDTDEDGLIDRDDACPTEKEDFDGFRDEDGCPEPTSVRIEITDEEGTPIDTAGFTLYADQEQSGGNGDTLALFGGPYRIDVEAEGYEPLSEQTIEVPDQERAVVTYQLVKSVQLGTIQVVIKDQDGQPIEGAAWEVLANPGKPIEQHDPSETLEVEIGPYTVRARANGYRPVKRQIDVAVGTVEVIELVLPPATVELTKDRIDIAESVYFETGEAVIKPASYGLLEEVALTIADHSELTKIRIEGHTDSRGDAAYNLKLSKERAAAVLSFLVKEGVEAGRLESEGYGESRPLQRGENESAWSKNRRVDFFVAERGDE